MKLLKPEEITEFPDMRELSPEELKEAYALSRAAFTAADLQGYTEEWRGVPMAQVLDEMEKVQRECEAKNLS